jgi:excisionase family DNA binding protein
VSDLRHLSVPDAARALGINEARVKALIHAGAMEAIKIGGRWLVSGEAIARRRASPSPSGRPFNTASAWAVVFLASGWSVTWLDASSRSRLRRWLRTAAFPRDQERLRRRAFAVKGRIHPGDLAAFTEERGLVLTGVSAASELGSELSPRHEIEAYVSSTRLPALRRKYAMTESDSANVVLRVVDGHWPFPRDVRMAPKLVVALDLVESTDPRVRDAGLHLLRGQK